MVMKYERVYLEGPKGTSTPIYLCVKNETATTLSGYEVDHEGNEIQPAGYERRYRIIDKTAITKRVVVELDKTYGTLKNVKKSDS